MFDIARELYNLSGKEDQLDSNILLDYIRLINKQINWFFHKYNIDKLSAECRQSEDFDEKDKANLSLFQGYYSSLEIIKSITDQYEHRIFHLT